MGMVIPQEEYQGLQREAAKHSSFHTFRDEMHRLAESLWHQARADGNTASPEEANQQATEEQPAETPQEVTPTAPVQQNPGS